MAVGDQRELAEPSIPLGYRTAAAMCLLVGLFALIIVSADESEDLLLIPFSVAMPLGLSAGRWLYRRLRRQGRQGGLSGGLREAFDAVPGWLIVLLLGPVLTGPVFIAGGAGIATAAVASLLFGPAVAIAVIGGLLLSFWLLAGPAWLISRLWPHSHLAAPGLAELKHFSKDMIVGSARELR